MSSPSSGVPFNVRKPSSSNDTGEAGPASPPPEGRDGSPAATVHATADASARCASHEEPSVPVGMLADARLSMGMGGGDAELAGASMLMGMGGGGTPGTVEVGVASLIEMGAMPWDPGSRCAFL